MVDRRVVMAACAEEALAPPFGVGHLQMLGERMRVPLAVTGLVRVCEVNPRRRAAQVTLVAELVETLGGNRLASARGVASARAEPGEVMSLGQLVDRALSEAAADVVRSLTDFDPAGGLVVATLPDGRVVLDAPEKPGLRTGDALLVYREAERGELVGVLQVQTVHLTVVHATPLAGEDFRHGDRAVLAAR